MFRNTNIKRNIVGLVGTGLMLGLTACGASIAPSYAPQEEIVHIDVAREKEYTAEAMPIAEAMPAPTASPQPGRAGRNHGRHPLQPGLRA